MICMASKKVRPLTLLTETDQANKKPTDSAFNKVLMKNTLIP